MCSSRRPRARFWKHLRWPEAPGRGWLVGRLGELQEAHPADNHPRQRQLADGSAQRRPPHPGQAALREPYAYLSAIAGALHHAMRAEAPASAARCWTIPVGFQAMSSAAGAVSGHRWKLALQMSLRRHGLYPFRLGGFAGGESFDADLHLRWPYTACSKLVFRPHAGSHAEPVFHDLQTAALARDAIRLRYRLLPDRTRWPGRTRRTGMPLDASVVLRRRGRCQPDRAQ